MTTRTFLKLLRQAMKNYSSTFIKTDMDRMEFVFGKVMEELKKLLQKERKKTPYTKEEEAWLAWYNLTTMSTSDDSFRYDRLMRKRYPNMGSTDKKQKSK